MAKLSINAFFADAGFPLHNPRWSWGAGDVSNQAVMLRTWDDHLSGDDRYVRVLGAPGTWLPEKSPGRVERIEHLRRMWAGAVAGYAVLAKAADVNAKPRQYASLKSGVREILALRADRDSSIWAELGSPVQLSELTRRQRKHRVAAGAGPFPVAQPAPPAKPPAAYVAKLPAMRAFLIDVAARGATVSYAQARAPFGVRPWEHRHAMDRLGHECLRNGEPILTSLIVDETGRCSSGFYKEFGRDDIQERRDCYEFWSAEGPGAVATADEELEVKAIKFAQVAQRPDQVQFRRRVFMYWGGRCPVTGCDVDKAMDAAHREGRDWKLGHNRGSDGFVLRKDIHALYDARLLTIGEDGRVGVSADPALDAYREFDGRMLLPRPVANSATSVRRRRA